ncbi:helix-turn-helix domain-containing protein [Idiomarina aquatica]|uniref:HTH cro/C1-type domain-containing protein n=1 Tax=Idiomarina aquatica TaxID=1327752 RepID=A0AA94EGT1_9GAMM|nr:helix-turn-helix transcriptional regulator [Idiomarina aquatica]RUO44952.1 hypothetical protein CWE23_02685 [Idiomarina aquatica]
MRIAEKEFQSNFGERLKLFRKSMKLTQAEMAEKVGMSLKGYQGNERGVASPSAMLVDSCVDLGVNSNWLLTGKGDMLLKDAGVEKHQGPRKAEAVMSDRQKFVPKDDNGIGARLFTARNHLNYTQGEIAERLGMSTKGYQHNEKSYSIPNALTLVFFVQRGFSARWLLTGQGEMLASSESNELLAEPSPLEAQVNDNKEKIKTLWECARDMNIAIDCLRKMHERTRQPLIKRVWDWVFGNNIKA